MKQREKILAAAIEVFSEKPYHRARVAEIAKRAGVAVGTIYRFYEGKAEIFREAVRSLLEELSNSVKQSTQEKDPVKALKDYIEKVFEFTEKHKSFIKNFLQSTDAIYPIDIERFGLFGWYEAHIKGLRKIIERGKESGKFKADTDTHLAVVFLSGAMMNVIYSEARELLSWDIEKLADEVFKIACGGLLK